jgi:hypothetical protein
MIDGIRPCVAPTQNVIWQLSRFTCGGRPRSPHVHYFRHKHMHLSTIHDFLWASWMAFSHKDSKRRRVHVLFSHSEVEPTGVRNKCFEVNDLSHSATDVPLETCNGTSKLKVHYALEMLIISGKLSCQSPPPRKKWNKQTNK